MPRGSRQKWTDARRAHLVRDSRGRFQNWTGGAEAETNGYSHHGTKVHIGKKFREQTGRKPKIGDIHRTQLKNGKPHPNAPYYVYTKNGWRKTHFMRKPTRAQALLVDKKSRPGRR